MIRFDLSLHIARPLEDVFAFWADPNNLPKWQSGIVSIAVDGDVGRGCRWTLERKALGKTAKMRGGYTAYEDNTRLCERTKAGPVVTTVDSTFHADGGGTRIDTKVEVELGGTLGRLGEKVAKGPIRKQAEGDQKRLKQLLEG